ncbi:MAG TPA: amidohydrolase family protein [Puia sp.]|jgi:imidazolonepropionase-like amidohydrolase|nr:amidohydrolase family protein [Puia sp.]
MKKVILLLLFSTFLSTTSFCQFSPGYYALKDVSVIDGISKNVLEHYTIIIRNKYIEAVGPVKEITIPDSAIIFNYSGKYVMPGLIDSHMHLATDPSNDDNRIRAEKDLKDMLLSGITTVRDMAGDARALASLSRDAELDEIISPDIYYAALMAGPGFFKDPRTHQTTQGGIAGGMPYMKAVTDSTDLKIAVAEAKGSGATAIKLYAEISGSLAKRITDEAHKQNLLVWSHANLDYASPLEVVNAGVNSISHAAMISNWNSRNVPSACLKAELPDSFWDSVFRSLAITDLIKAMLKNKTILDATILTFKEAGTDHSLPDNRRLGWFAMYEIGKRFTKLAHEKGIPVCAGTDLDEKRFVQREIKLLVNECDFTPMDALISATATGARATGIEKTTGTIQAGKIANLVLLSADPAQEIDNLDKVVIVIKNGKLFNANK